MSYPYRLTSSNAYHSYSDQNMRCPHCGTSNEGSQKLLGAIQVEGSELPTYHCTSCNRVYSDMPAAIKALADEVRKENPKATIGFVHVAPHNGGGGTISSPQQFDYTLQQNTQQTNQKLDNLTYTIENLMEQVRQLAMQNNKLMEQLATDPLISIRKNVTEFDLK